MTTDTSERGLERLICAALTGSPCEPGAASGGTVREPRPEYGGSGWVCARRTTTTASTASIRRS